MSLMNVNRRLLRTSLLKACETKRVILVSNLSPRSSPAVIQTFFENYGSVFQVHRKVELKFGKYIGPAFVQFYEQEVVSNILMQRKAHIDDTEVEMLLCEYLPSELLVPKDRVKIQNKQETTTDETK